MNGARHALVTGGGTGIGLAISRALTGAGCRVTVLGRREAPLRQAVASGAAAAFLVADVTDAAALGAALGEAGPLDILVNNAGSAPSGAFLKRDAAVFQTMLDVHLLAAVHACRVALPGMIERRRGRILNVASTAALRGYGYVTAYCAAKHALLGFTRALAVEVAKTGVTVNALCPGYTDTALVGESVAATAGKTGRSADDLLGEMMKDNPLGRLVAPAEVAAAAVWLASDAAASVTGQALAIDGGETA